MLFEIRRMKNNHIGLFSILACVLCAILGLFLLVSLDGYSIKDISLGLLQYSVYTVYTQFGFFIFPVIPIYLISMDYKDKNILFYKESGKTPLIYFLDKVCALLLCISFGNILVALSISIPYRNFKNSLFFFMKIESVSIFIILIASLLAYMFKDMMIAYGINFAVWVFSIVLSTINKAFSLLCFYDASLDRHINLEQTLKGNNFMDKSVINESLYNAVIFLIVICIVQLFRKRWVKNGI